MDGKSLDIKQDKLDKLKELFPEVFTEDKVDWEKLKATLGEDINFSNERYVLNWAGKSDAFRALQTPTTATLIPAKEESVNFDDTNHLFIEGENLEVLKVLQKSYYGKIKMIYIDPPYNTGSDNFIYPDKFSESKDDYLKRIGDKDEAGYMTKEGLFRKNSKDSGHYHSNWLSMMYPRLFLAKNLLCTDGTIFVSIDENEVSNLQELMNEIFGEENYIATLIWQKRKGGGNDSKFIAVDHEYILIYKKNKFAEKNIWRVPYDKKYLKRYKERDEVSSYYWDTLSRPGLQNPIIYDVECPDGTWIRNGEWQISEKSFHDKKSDGNIKFEKGKNGRWTVFHKVRQPEGKVFRSIIQNVSNSDAASEMEELFGNKKIFDNPKPSRLIESLIYLDTINDSIILDFFAGSSPLAQAVYNTNRFDGGNKRFICVQLPEKTVEGKEAHKAGYRTIADLSKERIRRVIQKIEKEQKENKDLFSDENHNLDLGFKVFKLHPSNFKIWRGDAFENGEDLKKQLDAFTDPVRKDSPEENMLYELLLKSGYDLNSRIEKKSAYYVIDEDEMVVALSEMNEEIVKEIIELKPKKCIALDKLFAGNDQLKTNTVLQMKDAGIEFKTI
ncbi:MAG TPA: site-specific DNA-methyltransferase [Candidatus Moranbacteria bacterium]|nr:site-specific DNA-methyltransferase [Candidatus Moranbacteria bacterium]